MRGEDEEGFDRFWAAYPRKNSKQEARRAWEKLRPNAVLQDLILVALCQQKASEQWARENGRYIPYPATWLNQRRWEDEVAPGRDIHSGLREFLQGGPM